MSFSSSETTSIPATDTNIDRVTNGQVSQQGQIAGGLYDGTQTQVENLFNKVQEIGDADSRKSKKKTYGVIAIVGGIFTITTLITGGLLADVTIIAAGIGAALLDLYFVYKALTTKGTFSNEEQKLAQHYKNMYNNALGLRDLVASEEYITQKDYISGMNETARKTNKSTQKRIIAELDKKDFNTFINKSETIANASSKTKDIVSSGQGLLNSLEDLKRISRSTNNIE